MNNIKRNIFLVLAAAVLLASCGQDEVMTDTGHDGLVPVTLSAAVGDGVQTRTVDADNDEKPTRCYVQAFTTDDNGTTLTPAPGDLARPLDMGEPTAEGTFSLSDVYINPNETYVFLYWADNVEKNDAPDLEDLRFADYFKDRIAWAKRSEIWKYQESEPTEITAELKHVVAKVTLKTTTNVEGGNEIIVTVPTTYVAYNVADETVIQELVTYNTSFEHAVIPNITGTKDGTEVFSFYALVDEANQDLTLADGTNSQQVSNVPLGPNKHTTLVGDVKNLGLTNVTFTASVDEKWGSTPIIGEGYEIDSEGNYTVTTAEGLQAWATAVQSNPSLSCTLADNIILPEVTDGGSNWTTIGNFAGTFDGAGHTITGLTSTGGLIGEIGSGGKVQNLTLEEVDIKEGGMVGAIVGQNSGEITDCSVQGSVAGTKVGVGGIAGINNGAITGCSMEGIVTNTSSNTGTGGIVGLNESGSVIDCHSSATVTGYSGVGGIVGKMYQDNPVVIACYSTGNVTGSGGYYSDTGGVVGNGSVGGAIICCYATGDISGKLPNIGGVVGYNRCNVVACYYAGSNISGVSVIGGVAGVNDTNGTITACYWSNYTGSGIGNDKTNAGETTKVDGVWTDAVSKMNNALTDYDWEWSLDTTNPYALPTPVKKVTN